MQKVNRRSAGVSAVILAGALTAGAGWGFGPVSASSSHGSTAKGSGSSTLNAQDRMFLHDAAQGGKFEVIGGWEALHHSWRGDVRYFGKRMIQDHGREGQQLKHLAARLGVTLPSKPSEDQVLTLRIWSKTKGGSFDCSYIPVETVDHQLDIAEYKDEVKDGSNQQVRDFAKRWLPVLQQHLKLAEQALAHTYRCSTHGWKHR